MPSSIWPLSDRACTLQKGRMYQRNHPNGCKTIAAAPSAILIFPCRPRSQRQLNFPREPAWDGRAQGLQVSKSVGGHRLTRSDRVSPIRNSPNRLTPEGRAFGRGTIYAAIVPPPFFFAHPELSSVTTAGATQDPCFGIGQYLMKAIRMKRRSRCASGSGAKEGQCAYFPSGPAPSRCQTSNSPKYFP
jgi:hypothetical protein